MKGSHVIAAAIVTGAVIIAVPALLWIVPTVIVGAAILWFVAAIGYRLAKGTFNWIAVRPFVKTAIGVVIMGIIFLVMQTQQREDEVRRQTIERNYADCIRTVKPLRVGEYVYLPSGQAVSTEAECAVVYGHTYP